jgi:hypothetical protein
VRATIAKAAPDATETISYGIPAFKLRRILVYSAAFKLHIGLYPPVKGDAALEKAVAPYAGEKGNLRFPIDQKIPSRRRRGCRFDGLLNEPVDGWRCRRPRRRSSGDDDPNAQPTFFANITMAGGPAPVRAYIHELLPDVLEGRIEPGLVFDRITNLDGIPDGYRARNKREAIKVMIKF